MTASRPTLARTKHSCNPVRRRLQHESKLGIVATLAITKPLACLVTERLAACLPDSDRAGRLAAASTVFSPMAAAMGRCGGCVAVVPFRLICEPTSRDCRGDRSTSQASGCSIVPNTGLADQSSDGAVFNVACNDDHSPTRRGPATVPPYGLHHG